MKKENSICKKGKRIAKEKVSDKYSKNKRVKNGTPFISPIITKQGPDLGNMIGKSMVW